MKPWDNAEKKCPECDGALWLQFEKGGYTMAEPCPACKPREWEAREQGRLNNAYFAERAHKVKEDTEDERKRKKDAVKERFA